MIKKFEEFSKIEESTDLPSGREIDARENLGSRSDITVSTEIDPGHESHPTISVYFPQNLYMYIDLEKIDVRNYDSLSGSTAEKIGSIVQDLDNSLDYELRRCIENMQAKLIKAAEEIQQIPEITGKRYGI